MLFNKSLATFGRYLMLMGRTFSRPERMRMFFKQYIKEMSQLGVDSIGIVLLISFFIGAVICIQIKLNIQSPWMPKFVTGYTTREIMLLEFSSSIMCLILAGKVGSNIASEIGTMRVTQQIDALEIMGVNSANYLILPKVLGMMTMMPFLVCFSIFSGFVGAYATPAIGPERLSIMFIMSDSLNTDSKLIFCFHLQFEIEAEKRSATGGRHSGNARTIARVTMPSSSSCMKRAFATHPRNSSTSSIVSGSKVSKRGGGTKR